MAKQDSAVLTMNFELDGVQDEVIDLSQCASILNRRFYRQGMNWVVSGFRLGWNGVGSDGFQVGVYNAPQSWVISGAWTKAMNKWRKQQNDALKASDSMDMKSRFADFKVFLDGFHANAGENNNLLPVTPGGLLQSPGVNYVFPRGEWEYSKVVTPVAGGSMPTQEWSLTLLGADNPGSQRVSCVDGYQKSRAVPQSPDPAIPNSPDTSWMNEMFDDGNTFTEVAENATETNNDLPYDQDNYPYGDMSPVAFNAQLHRQMTFTGTTIGKHQNLEGGLFPCGLVAIRYNNLESPIPEGFKVSLQVLLAPGPTRGYLVQDMKEMN